MDPFDELYWNLNQLVAWVYLRDRHAVDRAGGAEPNWPDWEIEDPADSPDQPTRIPAPEEWGDEGPKFNKMKEREAVWGKPFTDVNMEVWASERGGLHFECVMDAETVIVNELRQNKLMILVSESDGPNGQTSPTNPEVEFLDSPRFEYDPPRIGRWRNPRFRREEALALWLDDIAEGSDWEEPGPPTPDPAAEYAARVGEFRANHKRPPTAEEDEVWRKGKGLKRDSLRDLRKQYRTKEEKKGGHPPKS